MAFKSGMRPVHPGEVLRTEYLEPLGLSAHALAKALRLTPSRINDIVLERRGITADTAVRLAHYFGGDAQFWLNLQAMYDLRIAQRSPETRRAVRGIEPRTQVEDDSLVHSSAA
ncbi:MAG: HigA family addiction module antitoxin [Xanthobacteraceae bacterium]